MGYILKISEDNDGRRVDRVLRTLHQDIPLGAIMKAIRTGEVRVNGKKTKGDARVEAGQEIYLPWNGKKETLPQQFANNMAVGRKSKLTTIYRDDFLWIINKPAGILTQPDVKGGDSLITRALNELNWQRCDFRPSAVQRLDRNTTGAIIIALTGSAQRILSELIRERAVRKLYHAAVEGIADERGKIDKPLYKDTETNIVRVDAGGQQAITIYRRINIVGNASLVEAELVTGRPHQARVHMASVSHPIIGDTKYGNGGAKRPLLHARQIIFPRDSRLPERLSGASFYAPIPQDMKKYEVNE